MALVEQTPPRPNLGGVIGVIYSDTLTVIVRENNTYTVPLWKFPGGGIEAGETPEEAVSREVHEETGIFVPAHAFKLFRTTLYGKHYLFARTSNKHIRRRAKYGKTGEQVRLIELEKIADLPDFLNAEHHWLAEIAQLDIRTQVITGPGYLI